MYLFSTAFQKLECIVLPSEALLFMLFFWNFCLSKNANVLLFQQKY